MTTDIVRAADLAVTVENRSTGELLDIATCGDEDLAGVLEAITTLRGQLADDEAVVHDELRRRLDRAGVYTRRIGLIGPLGRREIVVSAPSKVAGTSRVDPSLLRAELGQLLEAKAIDVELARAALKRKITVVAHVDVDADLLLLAETLRAIDAIGPWPVHAVKVETSEKVADAGCKQLTRAGHGGAVESATVAVPAPHRPVTVKVGR